MVKVKSTLSWLRNTSIHMKGTLYPVDEKGICIVPESIASIILNYNKVSWIAVEEKPVVIDKKTIAASVEAVEENNSSLVRSPNGDRGRNGPREGLQTEPSGISVINSGEVQRPSIQDLITSVLDKKKNKKISKGEM